MDFNRTELTCYSLRLFQLTKSYQPSAILYFKIYLFWQKMSAYWNKLNPYRKLKRPHGVKGLRQGIVITNKPSLIDQNQQLLVRFPNQSNNDVIIPQSVRLAFEIEISSKDANTTIYQNLVRVIVKKTTIRISGNEFLSIDDHCCFDLWKGPSEQLHNWQKNDPLPPRT